MKDQVVFITGGSSGYGEAMARKFAKEGARVIVAARDETRLARAAASIGCDRFQMDVTVPADWTRAVAFVQENYGKIDVLVNNAGGGVAIREVAEQSIEDIDRAILLNLNSVIYACRAFAPMFKARRGGTILNISSVCARQCWPGWSVYAAAKAGVLNFSKGLYVELQPYRVRVTCVIPAAATTGFNRNAGLTDAPHELTAEDVADTALYVAKLPPRAVVEDVTVWGVDQIVNPL